VVKPLAEQAGILPERVLRAVCAEKVTRGDVFEEEVVLLQLAVVAHLDRQARSDVEDNVALAVCVADEDVVVIDHARVEHRDDPPPVFRRFFPGGQDGDTVLIEGGHVIEVRVGQGAGWLSNGIDRFKAGVRVGFDPRHQWLHRARSCGARASVGGIHGLRDSGHHRRGEQTARN